jgi:SAM-dependent methyltransferase
MVDRARKNAVIMGFENVIFFEGEIDKNPLDDAIADVVVSNCVFNLIPDRQKAFAETFRIIKPGGHFSISDVIIVGEIPLELRGEAELYAGCVSGAMEKSEYLKIIENVGFENIKIQKEKPIEIPENILDQFLTPEKTDLWKSSKVGIFSMQ